MFETAITALLLIFILWVLFSHHKTSEKRAKAVNMSLFSINSVEDFVDEFDLPAIFKKMHLKGWNRFLYGDPYISLEKVIYGGKENYYVAIPKKYEEILSQNPHLSKVGEEILLGGKHYASLCLHRKQPRLKFESVKIGENEGLVLQILARHNHLGGAPVNFESNVRVASWADSKDRAMKILDLKKINERENRDMIFDFFSRIFENKRRVSISFGELKDFLTKKFV